MSVNNSLDLKNYGNKAMILELKEYFIKLMSCSTILYAYFGENLIKLYRKLKVIFNFIMIHHLLVHKFSNIRIIPRN